MAAGTDSYLEEDEPKTLQTEYKTEKKKKKKNKQKMEPTVDTEKDEETMSVRVKQIVDKPEKIPPIVVYFSSGYDPCGRTLKSDQGFAQVAPRVRVYRHKAETKSKRLQVVVSPPGSNVEFVGSNYAGEGATRQTCVYTLGVLDKETQTLKIVPIASNKIFRLEPRVGVSEFVETEPSSSLVKSEVTAAERAEKARKLNNLYGTKTAINRDKKMRALNPGDDPESKILLDEKLKEVEIKEALESISAVVTRNIPPYDASATIPREAYRLDQIILSGEWDFLEDIYRLLLEGVGAATNAYPVFVRNRIYKLRDIKDEVEKKTLSCIFSFITHLIKFKDVHSIDGMSSAKDHKFPGIIRQRFRNLFADSESKRLQTDRINLLISYVLVLTLFADEFRSDPADIAKDLRMSPVMLRPHFENLGCKFSRENSVLLATLPVPLKFPEVRQKRRRR